MGIKRNVLQSTLAVGLLIVGLLVLIPSPVAAVQAQAPTVAVLDRLTDSDGLLQTILTTTIVIPEGEFIPVAYGEIRYTTDPATFDGTGRLVGTTCVATILSVSGIDARLDQFNGYGYGIVPGGYGYDFDSRFTVDFSGLNLGYGAGYGYGYGQASAKTVITVTLSANDCPGGAAIPTGSAIFVTFQAVVGADAVRSFASLPSTVLVRNPEDPFDTTGLTGDALGVSSSFQGGDLTRFNYGLFAGAGLGGGDFIASGPTLFPLPIVAGTFVSSLQVRFNSDLPEGVNLNVGLFDQDTTGGPMDLANPPFNINPTALGARTVFTPFGFLQVTMSGLPAGMTPGQAIDLVVVFDIPQSSFAGPPALSPARMNLLRFDDDGSFNSGRPSCSYSGASGTDYRFTCTITEFSAFASVASAAGGGGGGVVPPTSASTTEAPAPTDAPTSSGPGTDSPDGPGTDGPAPTDGSQPLQPTDEDTPKKDKGFIPGVGLGLMALALVALAFFARRKM